MRLITRLDFDGIVCSALLLEQNVIDRFLFVHPKDVQDGKVQATSDDVVANIPYIPGCGLWFDHHASEEDRLHLQDLQYKGASRQAPSAAQVIWEYYGGERTFSPRFTSLLSAVNKSDSADLTRDEILNPTGWILVSYIADPRTGLGRFTDYKKAHYPLMQDVIQQCRTMSAEEILAQPDMQERVVRYFEQQKLFEEMLHRCCRTFGNVLVTNLLDEQTIYAGNRFLVYALYPEQNIEIRLIWGREKQNVVFAVGHSIVNRTSNTNVGKLMLEYGGGGHTKVGTCQIDASRWERVLAEIAERLRRDG